MTTIRYPTEPEPYIWLQEDEEEGSADCGCHLLQDPDNGAKFSFCSMHAAAEELLETLAWALEHAWSAPGFPKEVTESAHALVRRARGATP